jgi:gliding motility-associated-like protein
MYFYNPQSLSGSAAQQFAESLGANLISVQSAAENSCISSALTSNGFGGTIWIGFTDENSEGTYYWYDGSPVVFTNWNGGEPNNSGGNEDCTQIFPNGLWNDLNCNGGGSKSVIEVSLCPQITASNDTTICNSTAASLVCSDAKFGSAPYVYTWSDGQSGQSISVSPVVTTTYTVTATDRYGCYTTEDVIVSVVENVVASFTSSDYCIDEVVQFIDNSTITNPDVLASSGWDFGDATQLIGNQVTHQYAAGGNYVVTHAVSTVNGCVGTAIENITIYEAPSVGFNLNNACPGVAINFEDNSLGNGTTITNWNWNFGDNIGTGTNSTESYSYLSAGSFDVSLIVVDNQGCTDTLIQSVEIYEEPLPTFNYMNGCLYDTVHFIDASIVGGGNIIAWSWDIDGDNNEDYTSQNVDHKYTVPGDYNITLVVESDNNCTNSITQIVSLFPVPIAGFSASTACVNGDATQFVNTSTISGGNIILNGWNFGDGGTSTQQSPSHDYQIASSYPVTLAVVSDLGCIDSVTYSIEVLGKPSAAFTQDTTNGCPPLCIAFTDTSFDDIPITNWNWKFENNYGESLEQNPTYCYNNTGDYDVGLIITNVQGCKDTLENLGFITIYPLPVSDFTVSPVSTNVLNSTIDFTNNSTDAAAWIWNFGDGSEDDYSNYSPSHLYSDSGHFETELIVINSYLCRDTSYQNVEILPVDDLFVPSAFSPNGDGKNDILYARGYIGVMYFAVFDRLGNKVFESEDKEIGWDGLIKGKNALEGVYTWYLQAEVNGKAYKLKGDVTLIK